MNRLQKQEVGIEILVGLFMFTVLIALGVFTIVLSQSQFWKKTYEIEVFFSEISGLRTGDAVHLRGMNVGSVKTIDLMNGDVKLVASLNVPVKFHHGYKIEVINSSMLGGKYLKLYEGKLNAPELPADVRLIGDTPIDMLDEMGKAIKSMQAVMGSLSLGEGSLGKLLKDETVYNNLVVASEDMMSIAGRLNRGEGTLGRLMSSDDTVYSELSEAIHSLKKVATRLDAGEGTVGRLLQEDELYVDARDTMKNLRLVSENLAQGKGILGQLMQKDEGAYDDLKASLSAIRSIAERISNGEGSLGKMVKDDQLYDETTYMMEELRAAIDDMREASPITSFGSVLFGAF